MRKSELERLVKEQGEKIEELGIIPKAREIAQKLGKGGSCSEKWASANYRFEGESLRIHYEVYAMGDQEIQIDYAEELIWHKMFHAKEGQTKPWSEYTLYVRDGQCSFEIIHYKPDDWMRKLGILYSDINKILRQRKDKEIKEEEAAKDPEVSENVLKDLQDRLGIKK